MYYKMWHLEPLPVGHQRRPLLPRDRLVGVDAGDEHNLFVKTTYDMCLRRVSV